MSNILPFDPGAKARAAHPKNHIGPFLQTLTQTARREGVINDPAFQLLLGAEAWTDAALFLLARAAPNWMLRRLAFDGGVWFCALTQTPNRPDWLDEAVEAMHPDLPRAILLALRAARLSDDAPSSPPPKPQAGLADSHALFCENVS